MTFSGAIRSLKDGKATKTPLMSGYVYRNDITPGDGDTWVSGYELGFKERNDSDGDQVSFYTFRVTTDAQGVTTVHEPSSDMLLDGKLLQNLMLDTWEINDTATLEEARTSTDARW